MPPPMRLGAPNNYNYNQQYGHPQAHNMAPPLSSNAFMNPNSMGSAFSNNGNSLSMGSFGSTGMPMGGASGLGGHDAQRLFASAPNQQHGHNSMSESGPRGQGGRGKIRDVWKHNLQEEMATLRELVPDYHYIAMDSEFPGLVARPMGSFNGKSDYHYQCLRCNVDLLKVIQLGITLFNKDGESPTADRDETGGRNQQVMPCTWQFNFKFSLKEDMYSEISIEALRQANVEFPELEKNGIDPFEFGALLMSSGLVCDEDVRWISFHGGYDFGYLTKMLLRLPLPDDEVEFDKFMKKFFPSIYDIKYLMKHAIREHAAGRFTPQEGSQDVLLGFVQAQGLQNLVDSFKIKRHGHAHQAGSDSLMTGKVFFRMREKIFNGEISDDHLGKVWGLEYGVTPMHSTPQHHHQTLQENSTPQPNGTNGGAPSTPNTGNAGLVSTTPAHNGGAMGPSTPGGAGGIFGNFQYGGRQ